MTPAFCEKKNSDSASTFKIY